ncbi:MAG: hypothetical protein JXP36_20375 [Bacteroidales bacterium]|nr:hypothetical protein [Bacteroidales bacterium]
MILIISFDYLFGIFYTGVFNDIKTGIYGSVNNSINRKDEVLILGSSRAQHHYNTNLISKTFNRSCYDGGGGGYGIFLNYAQLSERLKISKPSLVIVDVSPNVIVDSESYTKLNTLLPFYSEYKSVQEIIKLNPDFHSIQTISGVYRYNSTFYEVIKSNKENNHLNGYVPLEGVLDTLHYERQMLHTVEMDTLKAKYLHKMIQLCSETEVKLIILVSPTYEMFDPQKLIVGRIESICNENNVLFYDFSDFSKLHKKTQYFKDQLHMNYLGTSIYTVEVCTIIKEKITFN